MSELVLNPQMRPIAQARPRKISSSFEKWSIRSKPLLSDAGRNSGAWVSSRSQEHADAEVDWGSRRRCSKCLSGRREGSEEAVRRDSSYDGYHHRVCTTAEQIRWDESSKRGATIECATMGAAIHYAGMGTDADCASMGTTRSGIDYRHGDSLPTIFGILSNCLECRREAHCYSPSFHRCCIRPHCVACAEWPSNADEQLCMHPEQACVELAPVCGHCLT